MFFTDKRFNHPNPSQVLLYHPVHVIIGLKYPFEDRMRLAYDQEKSSSQKWDHSQKYYGKPRTNTKSHKKGKNQHHGAADSDPDNHLISVLHISNVSGQACYKAGGGETINIKERKILHRIVHIFTEIFGIASRGTSGKQPGQDPKGQRDQGGQNKRYSQFNNDAHLSIHNALVNQVGHQKRDNDLHNYFTYDKNRGQDRLFFILSYATQQLF